MKKSIGISLLACLLAACSPQRTIAPVTPDVGTLFPGLGDRTHTVSTANPAAQRVFDQGLSFLYAFNHDEAIRSFQKATDLDPACAMAWWGIAVANGPHINNPVVPDERARAAWIASQRAVALSAGASETERDLIAALASRYADPPPADRAALDAAYAAAMRTVWQRHPNDPDVGALFAEAMMDLRPWDFWTTDGQPQPGTEEIVATLERVMEIDPRHPLALHLYIHAVEASPEPGRAETAADALRDLQPGLGHLVHMPSHIDVRLGHWQKAIDANAKAMAADRAYRALAPKQGFYGLYMAHDNHMLAFAAMMNGQRSVALSAIDALIEETPAEWARDYAFIADGYMVMPLEVRMRFGLWDEVLAAPEFPEHFPFARAMRHYARGVALAATGDPQGARVEQREFLAKKAFVPADRTFGNNSTAALLAVAEDVLEGEILYREGKAAAAFAALRRAVISEDALRYDEPPSWIQPARHALGALLLKSGRAADAESVFTEDLARLPENGWGLFGLARSLERQGREKEAQPVWARFREVWARSEVELATPCYCAPEV